MATIVAKKPAETTKSDAVRKLASAMKAKGEKPRPSVIVTELKKQGVDVAAAQVSMVLKGMGFRPLRKRKKAAAAGAGKAVAVKAGPKKASVVSLEDLIAAKKVAGSLGGTDKAIAALQALKRVEG
jgi:arginine repressor